MCILRGSCPPPFIDFTFSSQTWNRSARQFGMCKLADVQPFFTWSFTTQVWGVFFTHPPPNQCSCPSLTRCKCFILKSTAILQWSNFHLMQSDWCSHTRLFCMSLTECSDINGKAQALSVTSMLKIVIHLQWPILLPGTNMQNGLLMSLISLLLQEFWIRPSRLITFLQFRAYP